ncbi:hypothetical protein EC950943_2946B, partial [Escherichia coli 95.0943]
ILTHFRQRLRKFLFVTISYRKYQHYQTPLRFLIVVRIILKKLDGSPKI